MNVTYTSFVPELIKQILIGNKVVTRRPVKFKPKSPAPLSLLHSANLPFRVTGNQEGMSECQVQLMSHVKRFCVAGDLLYIRETSKKIDDGKYAYFASSPELGGPWTPSMHMRREASRMTAEAIEVSVERLGDIENSEQNAKDEGFESIEAFKAAWSSIYGQYDPDSIVWCVKFKCHHCNVDELLKTYK